MKRVTITLWLSGMLIANCAFAQEIQIPAIDIKKEKFSDIKLKLENFIQQKRKEEPNANEAREKTEGIRQWLRDQEYHLNADGKVFNYRAKNFEEFLKLRRTSAQTALFSGGFWFNKIVTAISTTTSAGIRKGLGRLNTFAFDPAVADVMYAGAAEGGLWKTSDGGTYWSCITNGIPNIGVSCIAINPSNNNNIFIMTGEPATSFFGGGLLSSIGAMVTYDGGKNWFQTGLAFNTSENVVGYRIRIAPTNHNILVATTTQGIHQSVDGGNTWSLVQPSSSTTGFYDLEFLPGTSTCYATEKNTIYRSVDNGATWSVVPSAKFPRPIPPTVFKIDLAVTRADVNYLYALCRGIKDSVFLSTTATSTFTFTFKSEISGLIGNYQAWFASGLSVSPVSPSTVYAGDVNIVKSTNSGLTFSQIGTYVSGSESGYIHEDHHDIVTRGTSEVFVATDGGLFKSSDAGTTWRMLGNQIDVAEYQGFGGFPSDPNYFTGGTWHNGFHRYQSAVSYNISCCDQGDAMINPTNRNLMYLSEGNGFSAIYRSNDGGNSLTSIVPSTSCGCPDTLRSNSFRIMQMNPLNPNSIYVMYRDFWISFDGGTTWTRKITGSTSAVQAFAQAPTDTTRIYAIRGNSIIGTSNYGNTNPWKVLYTHRYSEPIIEITVDAANPNTFYFVCGGYNATNKVWKGTWDGSASTASVINYSDALPNVPVYKVVSQNTSTPGIYIGTDLGVFFRSNTGSWIEFNNGLPYCKVVDMEINYPNGLLTIATYGRGIWQSSLYDYCPADYDHGPYFFNIPVVGSEYFEASNSITSARLIEGGYGTNVTYNAGNFIQLNEGFEVKEGSEFRGYIQGCSNPVPLQLNGVFAGYLSNEKEADNFLGKAKTELSKNKMVIVPNPANSTAQVFFNLKGKTKIELSVYDVAGRLVKRAFEETLSGAGINSVTLDVSNLSNGVYFCKLRTGNILQTEKLVVIKK